MEPLTQDFGDTSGDSDDDSEPMTRWEALGIDTIEERDEYLGGRP